MQINCEFCGFSINPKCEDCCPNCDASYEQNPTYLKLKELELKKKEIDNKKAELNLKRNQEREDLEIKQNKQQKHRIMILKLCFLFIFVMLFVIPFTVGVFIGIKESINENTSNPEIIDTEIEINNDQKDDQKENIVIAEFNEFADNGIYAVKIDKIEEIPSDYPLYDNCINIAIHFVIVNSGTAEVSPWTSKVYCIVNGYSQQNSWVEGYKPIPTQYVAAGMSIDGYCIFRVPVDIETMQIKYKDDIIINVKPQHIDFIEN